MSSEVMPVKASAAQVEHRFIRGLVLGVVISVVISAAVWLLAVVIPDKTGSPFALIRDACSWIANTRIGIGILESAWVFPIIEGLHLLGIALSVGVLCWFDMRLMGLILADQPVSKVWRTLMPVAFSGFVLMFVTGGLLFWAEAITAYDSVHFWIKIALILLAGLNALYFEFVTHPGIAGWDSDRVPPVSARIAGLLSLVLWTAVIVTGRTMAYSF